MPMVPAEKRLAISLGVRLTVDDHQRLLAYAEARGVPPQDALRAIVREAVRQEPAPVGSAPPGPQ
jgi:hypothetical protein